MARAWNKFKLISLLHLKQTIDTRRSVLRAHYLSSKKAFDKLFRFVVRRAMLRRYFSIFRAMYPLPNCSPARRTFYAWKLIFVPWSRRLKTSFRKVAKLIKMNIKKKFLQHWEQSYNDICQDVLYKTRAIKKFKDVLSRVKLSWTLTKHRVIYSKVKVPSHFHDSDMYRRNAIYSKVITVRKSLFFYLKDNITHSKFILPGPFYRMCFMKRFFVFWVRSTIQSRNYYYEHRKLNRKIGKLIKRYFFMRHSIITRLQQTIVNRLFYAWKNKRKRAGLIMDEILYRGRLKRSFTAWSFAYSQLYLSRNLFSSPQAKEIRRISTNASANDRDGKSVFQDGSEKNTCSYSNILSNPYSLKVNPSKGSQRHLYQDKFLSFRSNVRSISAHKDSKYMSQDKSKKENISSNKNTERFVRSSMVATSVLNIPARAGKSSNIEGGISFSPSIIQEKSEYFLQNSATLLLSPYNTPAKQSWKSQPY